MTIIIGRKKRNGKLNCYFGHHKCASTWIHLILNNIFQDTGIVYDIVYRGKDFANDLGSYLKSGRVDFLSYTNADVKHISTMKFHKGFHLVRDPRDIVVSAYFSHLYSHPTDHWPELISHREALQKASKEEGLIMEMDFESQFFEHMYNWNYHDNNVFELKMEELIKNPYKGFLDIFEFLGLLNLDSFTLNKRIYDIVTVVSNKLRRNHFPISIISETIPGERILGSVFDHRFSKLSGGRTRGNENVKQHFRKGKTGDWKNHFTEEHIVIFKEKYNDLLLKLGYEVEEDWA